MELMLGKVTKGGSESNEDGYITYEIGGEEGEITLRGPNAARIAAEIVSLWNKETA